MNGRIYDPTLGRSLQADPHIQAPKNSQSYNRYSYVLTPPLSYTDPSGYFFKALGNLYKKYWQGTIGNALRAIAKVPILNAVAQAAACFYGGPTGCAAFAAASTYAVTGSLKAAFTNGAFAFVSAHVFAEIGSAFDGTGGPFYATNGIGHIATHAVTGGVLSTLQGGKFGHGFLSAGFSKFAMSNAGFNYNDVSTNAIIGRTTIAAVIGGTASKISGGKFGNGAATAAMAQFFNQEASNYKEKTGKSFISLLNNNEKGFQQMIGRPQGIDDEAGILEVYSHGSSESVIDSRTGERIELTVDQLSDVIRESGMWKEGMPIKLCSCYTGDGVNPIAQQLSNSLNTTVIAPAGYYQFATGNVNTNAFWSHFYDNGDWRTFHPNQSPVE